MEKNNQIGNNVVIKDTVILGNHVTIEDNVYIDDFCIVRDYVHIKANTMIGPRCILGESQMDFYRDRTNVKPHPLIIGQDSIVRSGTIIYGDTFIGDSFQTGHNVTIREKAIIGNHVSIGTLSDIQGDCEIGNYTRLHSNVHISQKSVIKEYVWIFPYVVLTNDPTPPSESCLGVTIEKFAVIATKAVLLPGVKIGEDALIGAGSIVSKDVEPLAIIVGNPGKRIGAITDIKNKETGESIYPWRYTFRRGMPWEMMGFKLWNE